MEDDSENEIEMAGEADGAAAVSLRKIKVHPVHSFYVYDENGDKSRCKSCTAVISGKNTTNLKNHLKFRHASKEHIEMLELEKLFNEKKSRVSTPSKSVNSVKQQSIASVSFK